MVVILLQPFCIHSCHQIKVKKIWTKPVIANKNLHLIYKKDKVDY